MFELQLLALASLCFGAGWLARRQKDNRTIQQLNSVVRRLELMAARKERENPLC